MKTLATLIMALLVPALLSGCEETGTAQPQDQTRSPRTMALKPDGEIALEAVQRRAAVSELMLPGKVQYGEDRFAKISSPLVGRVTEVRAKLGEKVHAGQVLLSIDSADIGQAYSDYVKADSDLGFSRRSYDLAKELYEEKALSRKELVQAENDFLKSQAEYRRARDRLLGLNVPAAELDKPRIDQRISSRFDFKAPISGTVIERNVTVGQMVGADPAQMLYTLADLEELQVVGEVYERDVSRIQKDMAVSVMVEAYPGEMFPGTVVYIGDIVDPATRTIKIRCAVRNSSGKLMPEMFARIKVEILPATATMVVPKEAALEVAGRSLVYVQTGDGGFAKRPETGSEG